VGFGVVEYTLVFRRVLNTVHGRAERSWRVVRPLQAGARGAVTQARVAEGEGIAQVLVVPICSTLALDGIAYESFLNSSGALKGAVRLLRRASLRDPESVDMARKQIQSLIMAAEVRRIVDGMSA
jgi:hypothetical protein